MSCPAAPRLSTTRVSLFLCQPFGYNECSSGPIPYGYPGDRQGSAEDRALCPAANDTRTAIKGRCCLLRLGLRDRNDQVRPRVNDFSEFVTFERQLCLVSISFMAMRVWHRIRPIHHRSPLGDLKWTRRIQISQKTKTKILQRLVRPNRVRRIRLCHLRFRVFLYQKSRVFTYFYLKWGFILWPFAFKAAKRIGLGRID